MYFKKNDLTLEALPEIMRPLGVFILEISINKMTKHKLDFDFQMNCVMKILLV